MTQEAIVAAPLPAGAPAGQRPINFAAHEVRANPHGAREDFEEMIAQLVNAVRPGVAKVVAANPGDWGIDVFVGDLGGTTTVWQSKFFYPKVDKSHQAKIRESFETVVKNAADKGFTLTQWILCVPSSMDAPTTKWWGNWKSKQERETGVLIELWDETELRSLLISPDADAVRRHYYEALAEPTARVTEVVGLAEEDADRLESALFVRQLRAAGHLEVMSSKSQFFNAELMAREVVDKGVPSEVAALSSADALVHSLWEDRFNDACQVHEGGQLPGLHSSVMSEIRSQHDNLGKGLPGGPVHTCGLMHRVVDNRRAGWVRNWRQVAETHDETDGAGPAVDVPDADASDVDAP